MGETDTPGRGATDRPTGLLEGTLHLSVLWAFAICQPLFDLLGRNPDFFVARGNTRGDILILTAVVTLSGPLLMLAIKFGAQRLFGARVERVVQLSLTAVLAAMIALQALGQVADGPGALLVALSLALGGGAAVAYERARFVPTTLTVLSPAPLVFAALFLFTSDVKELILPREQKPTASIAVPGKTPIVVVIFDEFTGETLANEQGQIDRSRYPNFAELADEGAFFPNATTGADFTSRAIPAILTGTYPTLDTLPTSEDQPNSIFSLLGSSYQMNVYETITRICPEKLCGPRASEPESSRLRSLFGDLKVAYAHLLLPQSLESELPSIDEAFEGFGQADIADDPGSVSPEGDSAGGPPPPNFHADTTTNFFQARGEQFDRWLAKLDGSPRTLNLVHIQVPHVPYTYFPEGQQYRPGSLEADGLRNPHAGNPPDPAASQLLQQRYLLQSGFTDRLLGELTTKLKTTGIWDSAILVVTADHGVSFTPSQPRRVPSPTNLAEIASVPLLVKAPGVEPGLIDPRAAKTIDVLPTIADKLGIKLPFGVEGRSLLRAPASREVSVLSRAGLAVSIPFPEFVTRKDALIRSRVALFGFGGGWAPVYAASAPPGMIGSRPSDHPKASTGGSAAIDDSDLLASAPTSNLLPAAIRATLEGVEPDTRIAVAVNGRIETVGLTYQGAGAVRLIAIVPPNKIEAGDTVELFELTGPGGRSLAGLGDVNG